MDNEFNFMLKNADNIFSKNDAYSFIYKTDIFCVDMLKVGILYGNMQWVIYITSTKITNFVKHTIKPLKEHIELAMSIADNVNSSASKSIADYLINGYFTTIEIGEPEQDGKKIYNLKELSMHYSGPSYKYKNDPLSLAIVMERFDYAEWLINERNYSIGRDQLWTALFTEQIDFAKKLIFKYNCEIVYENNDILYELIGKQYGSEKNKLAMEIIQKRDIPVNKNWLKIALNNNYDFAKFLIETVGLIPTKNDFKNLLDWLSPRENFLSFAIWLENFSNKEFMADEIMHLATHK